MAKITETEYLLNPIFVQILDPDYARNVLYGVVFRSKAAMLQEFFFRVFVFFKIWLPGENYIFVPYRFFVPPLIIWERHNLTTFGSGLCA